MTTEKAETGKKEKKSINIGSKVATGIQKLIINLFQEPFLKKNPQEGIVKNDREARNLIFHLLEGRIFNCRGVIHVRNDWECIWMVLESDILTFFRKYVEGQDLKNLNSEGAPVPYFKGDADLERFVKGLYNSPHIPIKDDLEFQIRQNCLDRINFKNGTFNLRRQTFDSRIPPKYYYFHTEASDCPIPDEDKIRELQKLLYGQFGEDMFVLLAYLSRVMSGNAVEDKTVMFLWGDRSSGKGTLFDIIHACFEAYTGTSSMHWILKNEGDKAATQEVLQRNIASIVGLSTKRLISSHELYTADRPSENSRITVKQLLLIGAYLKIMCAAGDKVPARALYQEQKLITPSAAILLQSNTIYPIDPADAAQNIVFFKTICRYVTKEKYDELKAEGGSVSKNIFIKDENFRKNLKTSGLPQQLLFLLARHFSKRSVAWPLHFFLNKKSLLSRNFYFLETLRDTHVCAKEGSFTPSWKLKAFIERFKAFLPSGFSPSDLINYLILDHRNALETVRVYSENKDGKMETLTGKKNLYLNPAAFELDGDECIELYEAQIEKEKEDQEIAQKSKIALLDCTHVDAQSSPILKKRDLSPAPLGSQSESPAPSPNGPITRAAKNMINFHKKSAVPGSVFSGDIETLKKK